jgi:hypothetical protein
MVADGFENTTTKSDLQMVRDEMVTKNELQSVRDDMATKADLHALRQDIDLMLDRHVGTFRNDFDQLAARVKKLEEAVLR